MQSNLEKNAIAERDNEIVRSEYNKTLEYGVNHKNAISDGDAHGKGTQHGGHTHFLPDASKGTSRIEYGNFDTENGGGLYDIEGRNDIGGRKKAMASSLYNKENPYWPSSIDTEANLNLGQYQIR
ncbi:MAG: hypothetical protein IKT40_02715 [Bacilli bacterium]|nr:hypothetical protein [Bacilli bacterium]